MSADLSDSGQKYDEIFAEFLQELGDIPSDTEVSRLIDSLVKRYPDVLGLETEIRARYSLYERIAAPGEVAAEIPKKLGQFRIVRPIGGGGMGEVYEAVQEPFERRVALKIIRRGRTSDEARSRFLREQEALARLHETHIVPILAGGEAEGGVQYFAMPFINGAALHDVIQLAARVQQATAGVDTPTLAELAAKLASTQRDDTANVAADPLASTLDHVAAHAAPVESNETDYASNTRGGAVRFSLRYFRSVAQVMAGAARAVQHAHEKGFVHRDVKPSNMMVDASGDCWIIDFGLADYVAQHDRERDASKSGGSNAEAKSNPRPVGTPAYMAPEQFRGQADMRSDVWGLAVTLYELLTLTKPFAGEGETLRANVEGSEPTHPRKLVKNMPRDLEAICLKAMKKNPTDRYATAAAFAEDLSRWLRGEPTIARPARLPRRAWLWSKRNKKLAAAITVAAACLIGGTIASLVAEHRTQLALNETKEAKKRTEEALVHAKQQREFAQRSAEHAEQQSKITRKTLNSVVFLFERELKNLPGAQSIRRRLMEESIDGLKEAAVALENAPRVDRTLAAAHIQLGDVFLVAAAESATGAAEDALNQYKRALLVLEQLDSWEPTDRRNTSVCHNKIGIVQLRMGRIELARESFANGMNIIAELAAANSENLGYQRDLSASYFHLAETNVRLGSLSKARDEFGSCIEIRRKLVDLEPTNTDYQLDLAFAYDKLGDVQLELEGVHAARDTTTKGLEIRQALANLSPTNFGFQDALALSHDSVGELNLRLGDLAAARNSFEASERIRLEWTLVDPLNTRLQRDLSVVFNKLGDIHKQGGDLQKSREYFEKNLPIAERLAKLDPTDGQAQRDLTVSLFRIGEVAFEQGDLSVARDAYRNALAIVSELSRAEPDDTELQRDMANYLDNLGHVYVLLGSFPECKEALNNCLALRQKLSKRDEANQQILRDLAIAWDSLGDFGVSSGDSQQAQDAFEESFEIRRGLEAIDPNNALVKRDLAISHDRLGDVWLLRTNLTEAENEFKKSFNLRQALASSDPSNA